MEMEPSIAMKWERKMMVMVVVVVLMVVVVAMMRMQLMGVVVHSKLSHRVVEGVYKMLGSDGDGRAEEIFTKMDK